MQLLSNLTVMALISIKAIPSAYRIGLTLIGHVFLHCRASSVFRNVGVSRYLIEEVIINIDDQPILRFDDTPTRHSSRGETNGGDFPRLQDTPTPKNAVAPTAEVQTGGSRKADLPI
ncbi:hypothetical protein PQX77_002129 [Marasmius sp. AFHP31]|nr:hypothetical protein PQX77_002129 [Marasmius sp. AFHP31]